MPKRMYTVSRARVELLKNRSKTMGLGEKGENHLTILNYSKDLKELWNVVIV